MAESLHDNVVLENPEPSFSLSHFVHVLRAYLPVILLSLAAVMIGYLLIAVTMYILAPWQRVTTLPFRLEFEGADRGEYPNGTKFSSAEIISTPVLLRVYDRNDVKRFTSFTKFANSVFVVESNAAQEALARDYAARLGDPRLTSVDRERIQREYELKLEGLTKSQFAINYLHKKDDKVVPEVVVRKVLHDILREWANFVSNEQHVLRYRVPVLSPDIVQSSRIEDSNPIMATEILRAKVLRIMMNIIELRKLPAGELIRSKPGELSLNDIQIRLDDIVRFRLEPLVHAISSAGMDDRVTTIRFLETQLAYDERQLNAQRQIAEASKNTMMMYSNGRIDEATRGVEPRSGTVEREENAARPETVMPQLSETFIDRLIQITSRSADHDFRQKFAEEYRREAVAVVPLEMAVAYDRSVLDLVRKGGGGGNVSREAVDRTINATREEVRGLVAEIRQIYDLLSANLNPSTVLMSVTGAPTTRVERAMSIKSLGLYGVLTMLLSLPVIIFACLIHNRVREEEELEQA